VLTDTPVPTTASIATTQYPTIAEYERRMKTLAIVRDMPLVDWKAEGGIWGASAALFVILSSMNGWSLIWLWKQPWYALMLDFGMSTAFGALLRMLLTSTHRSERRKTLQRLEMEAKRVIGDFRYSFEVDARGVEWKLDELQKQFDAIASLDTDSATRLLEIPSTEVTVFQETMPTLKQDWTQVEKMLKQNLQPPGNRRALQQMLYSLGQRIQTLREQCPRMAELTESEGDTSLPVARP